MALSGAQKIQIHAFLGWSGRWAQVDGDLTRSLASDDMDADSEAYVVVLLTDLARLDTAITAAESRLKASVVGSIQLNAREISQLRDRARQAVGRLATHLGVEVRSDAFGAGKSYNANPWRRGGGNAQRQG